MLAIGRNLNQIARKLNEGDSDPIQTELIKGLSAIIDKHTYVVSSAIRASLERWDLECCRARRDQPAEKSLLAKLEGT
ncbi:MULTISPECIES: plasmid mobilization relaxosome protein MobC [unclassified Pseudomonas]|uniref:plasmid mobilization relaxosome protein MobC n=1 Tax=unclassified Pseudomonas TaxID=196821 RepID=UPI0030D7400B